ncbi:hypothetical protein EDD86DRAFT_134259 [Gorgonomyces haynaldii]|nr:hypothetical protein EDD86DRAFT_134259 [Gorgonomyces haynaldii]
MNSLWVKYGNGEPVKVSTKECHDVADLIEAIKAKLELTVRLDTLHLLAETLKDFKHTPIRPGMSVSQLQSDYPLAGRDDLHPLILRYANPHTYNLRPVSKPFIDWKSISLPKDVNWWTMALVAEHSLGMQPFPLLSATTMLLVLNISVFIYLLDKESVKFRHFASSTHNLSKGRYWTLLTSSFAHADFNHLLCNLASLALFGPDLEAHIGFYWTCVFVCLTAVGSSIGSLILHGGPSLGFSGVLFAINGFFCPEDSNGWLFMLIDVGLFLIATSDTDHAGHAFGFLSGLLFDNVLEILGH